MKTIELRIGNWVIVKPFTQTINDVKMTQEHPQICQITGIRKMGDSAVVYVNDNIIAPIPIEYIMGVPLIEKVLLNIGFELVLDSEFTKRLDLIKDARFDYLINKQNKVLSGIRFKGNTFFNEVKCLHHLQNLFFDLTCQEIDGSCLRRADIVMHFEESNPEPLAINIKISDDE